uniref:uncharacterized protein LOC113474441 n=1 Tax=Ciona intestinalis TaxID=7719 RepID=UPI000EF4CBFB|nr:uncharacterized protein LOC113474441 [Ciona intestinalis]|eukprot:XP_026691305.1 uncharacterized protein LOC113474441 [Ciona intestinalis]
MTELGRHRYQYAKEHADCLCRRCRAKMMCPETRYNIEGLTCTFSCDDSLVLRGESSPTCDSDGSWTAYEPTCIKECEVPPPVLNSKVEPADCLYAAYEGMTCTYICNDGYQVVGPSSMTCNTDGYWTPVNVVCMKTCPRIDAISKGNINPATCETTDSVAGSACQFSCDVGHLLIGDETLVCTESGVWNKAIPNCWVKTCQDVKPLSSENSYTYCFPDEYPSYCSLVCLPPYQINGAALVFCNENGVWSGAIGTCELHCDKLPKPAHGAILPLECTLESRPVAEECTYTCELSYTFNVYPSSITRTCGVDGNWLGSPVSCTPTRQYMVVLEENDINNCIGVVYGSIYPEKYVIAECDETDQRYLWTLEGEQQIMNSKFGKCLAFETREPFSHLSLLPCKEYENTQTTWEWPLVAGANYTLRLKKHKFYIWNGYTSSPRLLSESIPRVGTRWRLLDIKSKITVSFFGAVNGNRCPPLPSLSHGEWSPTNCQSPEVDQGTRCTFFCNEGYEVSNGESSAQCGGGIWQGNSGPICRKSCLAFPLYSFRNGSVTPTQCLSEPYVKRGTVCSFNCGAGLYIEGEQNVMCLDDGSWSTSEPTCIHKCPPFQIPTHGSSDPTNLCDDISASLHKPNTVCAVRCDYGYVASSSPNLLCRHDGTWNNTQLTCKRKCQVPVAPVYGTVTCNNTDQHFPEGTSCTFQCDGTRKLSPKNSTSMYCLNSGVWSISRPECQNPCPVISPIANGYVSPPSCLGPDQLLNGQVCSFRCDYDYTLSSVAPTSCQTTGQWSNVVPYCYPDVHFIMKQAATNSCMIIKHYVHHNAFKVEKLSLTECNKTNTLHKWSRTAAGQIRNVGTGWCLTSDSYGFILVTDCDIADNKQLWECRILHDGFNFVSVINAKATESLLRTGSSKSLSLHLDVPDDSFTHYTWEAVNYVGDEGAVCGMASGLKTCPRLMLSSESTVSPASCYNAPSVNTQCTITCNSGYELQSGLTSNIVQCQQYGKWSSHDTICKKLKCQSLANPTGGAIHNPDCANTNTPAWSEIECKFVCYPGTVFVTEGVSDTLVCLGSGMWSDVAPSCLAICPALTSPTNGKILPARCTETAQSKDGDVCTVTCNTHYELIGSSVLECQNGAWSGSVPTCEPMTGPRTCPRLPCCILHGIIGPLHCSTAGVRVNVACYVACNWRAIPDRTLPAYTYCQANGKWSSELQSCKTKCPSLIAPPHSTLQPSRCSGDTNVEGDQCTVVCDSMYGIAGDPTLACSIIAGTISTEWSQQVPICVKSVQFIIRAQFAPSLDQDKCLSAHLNGFVVRSICNTSNSYQQWEWMDGDRIRNVATQTCMVPQTSITYSFVVLKPCLQLESHWKCKYSSTLYSELQYHEFSLAMGRVAHAERIFVVDTTTEEPQWAENRTTLFFASTMAQVGTICAFRSRSSCAKLPSIPNGYVQSGCEQTEDIEIGSECSYFCNDGYTLVGTSTKVCGPNGIWNDAESPSCKAECPPVPLPHYAAVTPTKCSVQNSLEGQVCNFKCYNVQDQITDLPERICESNGKWSSETGLCHQGCPILRVEPPATVSPPSCSKTPRYTGDVCTVSCASGYILKGSSVRTCTSSGVFTGEFSHCARSCPALSTNSNGHILPLDCLGNTKSSGDNCIYSCTPGYSIVGDRIRACKSDGVWSSEAATCKKTCQPLPSPTNGRLVCPKSIHTVGDICKLTCDLNYVVNGQDSLRTCLSTGQWSGTSSTCAREQQFILYQSIPPNEPVCMYAPEDGTDNSALAMKKRSECSYHDPANMWSWYKKRLIRNAMLRKCITGLFSAPPPYLVLRTCDETDLDQQWECAGPERTWFIRLISQDTHLRVYNLSPYPMYIFLSSKHILLYTEDGLDFTAERTGGITAHIQWYANSTISERALVCTAREEGTCRAIEVEGSVQIIPSHCRTQEIQTGGECYFSCPPLTNLVPSVHKVVCLKTGLWSNSPPECRQTCPILSSYVTDRMHVTPSQCSSEVTTLTEGNTCLFSCRSGMRLVGQARLTCKGNLKWNFPVPRCESVCPSLNLLEHGKITPEICTTPGTRVSEGTVCTYRCLQTELVLTTISSGRTCTSDGSWSGKKPYCVKPCPIHNAPVGGTVIPSQCEETISLKDMVCAFSCDENLVHIGSKHRICLNNGSWSGVKPACKSTCPSLDHVPKNGILKPASCGELKSVMGDSCSLLCEPGFDVKGEASTTCTESGTWSADIGSCLRKCSRLQSPDNGSVLPRTCETTTELYEGYRCSYECIPGYILVGIGRRLCLNNGSWSGSQPSCVGTCPRILADPATVAYEPISCTIQLMGVGSTCTAYCDGDLRAESGEYIEEYVCQEDLTWDKDPATSCFAYCGTASGINADIDCGGKEHAIGREYATGLLGFKVGTVCKVLCHDSYVLGDKDPTVDCVHTYGNPRDIFWSTVGSCRFEPDPLIIVNRASIIGTCFGVENEKVVLVEWPECGNQRLSTFWVWEGAHHLKNAKTGLCISVSDPEPNLILTMEKCDKSDPMQKWDCDEIEPIFIHLKDHDLRFHAGNGDQKNVVLKRGSSLHNQFYTYNPETKEDIGTICSRREYMQCPKLPLGNHANAVSAGCGSEYVRIGTECEIKCTNQNKTAVVVCTPTGIWDPLPRTACEQKCSKYEFSDQHARFLNPACRLDRVLPHTICTLACSPGYVLTGSVAQTTCSPHKGWTHLTGYECKKSCPEIDGTENGYLTPPKCNIGSCTIHCNSGYKIRGPSTRHCSESGVWTPSAFSCIPDLQFTISNKILFKGQKLCLEAVASSVAVIKTICTAGNTFQMWRWNSHYTLENIETSRCLAMNTSANFQNIYQPKGRFFDTDDDVTFQVNRHEDSMVVTKECNVTDPNQRWTCQASGLTRNLRLQLENQDLSLDSGPIFRSRLGLRKGNYKSMQWEGNHYTGSRTLCGFRFSGVCPPLKALYEGTVSPPVCMSEFVVAGTRCKFTCNPKYSIEGEDYIVCESNGRWSNLPPMCLGTDKCAPHTIPIELHLSPAECSAPRLLPEGLLCRAQCTGDRVLHGKSEFFCGAAGIWSSPLPKCNATCAAHHPPKNGEVYPPLCELETLPVNTVCNTTCNKGYRLLGDETTVCLSDGTWSGQPVLCQKFCTPHPSLNNGTVIPEHCTLTESQNAYTCLFRCNYGFVLAGSPKSRCSYGTWSTTGQKCVKDSCDRIHDPQVVENTIYSGTKNGAIVTNTVVQIVCRPGYEVNGPSKKVCLPTGSWSGGNATCELIKCGHLNKLYHGKVTPEICTQTSPGVLPGTTCYFACNEGYLLVGISSALCQDHGIWPKDLSVECQDVRQTAYHVTFIITPAVQYDIVERCIEATKSDQMCELNPCVGNNPYQTWRWYGSQRVQNVASQECLVMSDSNILSMAECDVGDEKQIIQCDKIGAPEARLRVMVAGLYLSDSLEGLEYIINEELSWWTGYEVDFTPTRAVTAAGMIKRSRQGPICSYMCGGLFTTEEGDISSPSYPNKYPTNVHCQWIIQSSHEDDLIQVDFSRIALQQTEEKETVMGCPQDYVRVRSGSIFTQSTTDVKLVCVSEGKFRIQSKQKAVHVDFHSNNVQVAGGFTAHWSITRIIEPPKKCGFSDQPFKLRTGKLATSSLWQAAVSYRSRYFCNAAIISERFVLTTYKCVSYMRGDPPKSIDELRVIYGLSTQRELLKRLDSKTFTEVQHIFSNGTVHDVCLVMTKTKILFSDQIQPICLEEIKAGTIVVPEESECWATKWSLDMFTNIMSHWRFTGFAKLRVISNEVCFERYRDTFRFVDKERRHISICLAHETNSGNSTIPVGSLMDLLRQNNNFIVQCRSNNHWYVVGTSMAFLSGDAILVTRIFHYNEWISSTMENADILFRESALKYNTN